MIAPPNSSQLAYFSMEMAPDRSAPTYSGDLVCWAEGHAASSGLSILECRWSGHLCPSEGLFSPDP
jgi:hypothetical protein